MTDSFRDKVCFALEGHGIGIRQAGDYIEVVGSDLKIWADIGEVRVHPSATVLQANIAYSAPVLGERWIRQCVAGVGADREAAEIDGLKKILHSSFHVVLNTLGEHRCGVDGTVWEDWSGLAGAWRINSSALLSSGSKDASQIPYPDLYESLQAGFLASAMPGWHWIEVFVGFNDGEMSQIQIELDGEPWPQGEEIVRSWPYRPDEPYLFLRHFLVATPAG